MRLYFQQMLLKHLSRTVIYQSQALFLLLKTTVHNNQSFRKYESEFLNLHLDILMKKKIIGIGIDANLGLKPYHHKT